MTFNPNIPQSGDKISQSQSQILTNFSQSNTLFGTDHVTFNDAATADRGKHNKTTLIEQSVDPATAANEMAIYTKAVSAVTQLFARGESSGTITQLSNLTVNSTANAGTAGGTIRHFDTIWNLRFLMGTTNAFSGTGTVTYPSVFSSVFGFVATANDGNVQRVSAQTSNTTLTLVN